MHVFRLLVLTLMTSIVWWVPVLCFLRLLQPTNLATRATLFPTLQTFVLLNGRTLGYAIYGSPHRTTWKHFLSVPR